MTNKYRGIEPLPPGQERTEEPVIGIDKGIRVDQPPWLIPLGASPNMHGWRYESGALRKDFGFTAIGTAAALRVLGLIEHKFIDSNQTFQRVVRITRVDGNAVLEVWTGDVWTVVDTSTEVINDTYLSMASMQGKLYAAEGTQILEWGEAPSLTTHEEDFPTTNSLTDVGDETAATISPADTIPLDYRISWDVEITTSPDEDVTVTVEIYHETTKIATRSYMAYTTDTFPVQFVDEYFDTNRTIDNNDQIKIKLASISGGRKFVTNTGDATGPTANDEHDRILNKSPATSPAWDNQFTYKFDLSAISLTSVNIGFYYWNGASYTKVNEFQYTTTGSKSQVIPIANYVDAAAKFRILVESFVGSDIIIENLECDWGYITATFDIHGHNKATDGDAPAGVEYVVEGAPVSTWQEVSVNAPAATFIFPFADRLVALRDGGDPQSVAWPVSGDQTDWTGAGSGQIYLVTARGDAIDPLQAGAVLGTNFAAIFRSRSIWRMFETGSVVQALGVQPWIENLGTESPFSVKNVKGGVIFLGHDLQVYFLTQQGYQPIGTPIQLSLVQLLTGNLDKVDSGYDPVFNEYYMGLPSNVEGSSAYGRINYVYIFDVDRFLREGELIWRARFLDVERFATVSEVS